MENVALEKIFKAVANRRRIAILKILYSQEKATVDQIAVAIQLSFKATSRHLNKLYNQGYLSRTQKGLYVRYRIVENPNQEVKTILNSIRTSLIR